MKSKIATAWWPDGAPMLSWWPDGTPMLSCSDARPKWGHTLPGGQTGHQQPTGLCEPDWDTHCLVARWGGTKANMVARRGTNTELPALYHANNSNLMLKIHCFARPQVITRRMFLEGNQKDSKQRKGINGFRSVAARAAVSRIYTGQ